MAALVSGQTREYQSGPEDPIWCWAKWDPLSERERAARARREGGGRKWVVLPFTITLRFLPECDASCKSWELKQSRDNVTAVRPEARAINHLLVSIVASTWVPSAGAGQRSLLPQDSLTPSNRHRIRHSFHCVCPSTPTETIHYHSNRIWRNRRIHRGRGFGIFFLHR